MPRGGRYEAAFAALVHLYGKDARSAITGITLLAVFTNTVGWPLTALLELVSYSTGRILQMQSRPG